MPLIDAVHAIETVGGVLLGISGIAFVLLGIYVEIRRKLATAEWRVGPKLDLVVKTEKRPVADKVPARKAA